MTSKPTPRRSRVLLLTQPTVGGAAVQVAQLAAGLDRGLFDVTVASPPDGWLRDRVVAAGCRHVLVDLTREIRPWRDVRSLLAIGDVLTSERPDLIHLHSSKAGFLGRLAVRARRPHARILYTPHGWAFAQTAGPARWLYLGLERLAAPLADRIVCVSETERLLALRARTGSPERIVVIPNGVELPSDLEAGKGRLRRLLRVGSGCGIVAMVARMSRPKRPEDLILAAARLAASPDHVDFRIVFIGGGPLEGEMRRLAESLGLGREVAFLGDRSDVTELLTDVDVFVLASASEGLPYTMLEAMAAAKPVVGSRIAGITDLAREGETGFCYPLGDGSRLAEILRRLLHDSELRSRLGSEGRRRIQKEFTTETMIRKVQNLYRSLLEERPLSRA